MTLPVIKQDVLHLHFEERSDIPKEFSSSQVIAHGFHKKITIQDFPVRGKKVFLHIKRRRWLNKQSKQVILELSSTGNPYDRRVRCFFKST